MTKNKIEITMDFLSTKLFRTNEEGEFRMKFKNIVMMVLMAVLGLPSIYAQETKTAPAAANNSGGGGAAIEPLERVTLEDFEESEDWRAKSTTPLGQTKVLKMIQRGIIKDVFDEKSVPDKKDDKGQYVPVAEDQKDRIGANHILGVKTFFAEKGFDRVELSPPHEYIIKGKARQISVWVLGRKFKHTMYAKFRDYRGNTHNIRLGRLDFFGWRKLTAPIPGYVPQSTRYSLLDKNIHFVSLFVASDVHEVAGDFYFYVDDLEVRSDKYDMIYPGFEIKDNW